MTNRVVVLIDMDCFYCQVETKLNPKLKGQPIAVVQYNQWKGGGIIAVNYEARERGVTRHMRGAEAMAHCPEIVLVSVPTVREKADLTRYRDAGREVVSVLCRFGTCVQRASVDEAYLDLTSIVDERMKVVQFIPDMWKSTYVVGYSKTSCNAEDERQSGFKSWLEDGESMNNVPSLRLAIGALIVEDIREAIVNETSYECSAGIAHNKILAKLACSLHKPNRQTVLPLEAVEELYKTLSVKKIRSLGGKLGDDIVENLGCKVMSDLLKFSEKELQNKYDEKTGAWLYNIARGIDNEPVESRLISKSIGCCKKFPGPTALCKSEDVEHWLNKLCEELSERLLEDEAMNKRKAQLLTVSNSTCSRSIALSCYTSEKIALHALNVLKKSCKIDSVTGKWCPTIKYLGLSAGKFSELNLNKIDRFFKVAQSAAEPLPPMNVNNGNSDYQTSIGDPESKSSFFERRFAGDVASSGEKISIIPDMSKNDLLLDSDDSQSSLIKVKSEGYILMNDLKENVKKNLFNTDLPKATHVIETPTTECPRKFEINNKNDTLSSIVQPKNACSTKTIVSFFKENSKKNDSVKLEELFPDLSEIDDDLLASLPLSYRKKVIKLREISHTHNIRYGEDNNKCDIANIPGSSNLIEKVSDESNPSSDCCIVRCSECGESVSSYELHMDMHLAIKLDKELNSVNMLHTSNVLHKNTENSKLKASSNQSNNNIVKKRKTLGSNQKVSKKVKSIDSFFNKI